MEISNDDQNEFKFIIKQPLFSKARPRLTRCGKAYMPAAYKDAQSRLKQELVKQWSQPPLEGPVWLDIVVQGEGRGDLDNIAGAFMDAAQSILFTDDRVSVISRLTIEWAKSSKADSQWIVRIIPLR
jgi:Holliday junction resolvase RusA-like endonuclease